ncbi:hypothetical protein GCM10027456_35660 [Kineosporia babensis]
MSHAVVSTRRWYRSPEGAPAPTVRKDPQVPPTAGVLWSQYPEPGKIAQHREEDKAESHRDRRPHPGTAR